MKKHFLGLFLAVAALTASCSDDDNNSGSASRSRDVKYEITGNFTGNITVAYMNASGGSSTAEVTSLPWQMEFTAQDNAVAAGFGASGSGGVEGQQVKVKIYQGGSEVGSADATVNSSGIFTATPPTITF
nr:MmpS family transport accessory protein [uncultured Flavobacterium sp.]